MRALRQSVFLLTFVMSLMSVHADGQPEQTNSLTKFNFAEWERKIKNPSLTDVEFTQLYAQFAAAGLTNAQIVVAGPLEITMALPDGAKWKFRLGNIWAEASRNSDGRPDICRHYLKSMSGLADRKPSVVGMAETNNVVPTIKGDIFLSEMANDTSERGIVSEPYVADLHIVYTTDRDGMIAFLTKSDQKRFNLDSETLRNLSVTNLKRIMRPVQERNKGPVFMAATGDGYSSSLLLLDDFWNARTNLVQGDMVAIVPSRDIVFYTGSKSEGGIQQLQQIAEDVYAKGDHVISKTLLVRRSGKWERFTN